MKTCCRCSKIVTKGSYCLGCKRQYERELYAADRDRHKQRRNNNRVTRAAEVKEYVSQLKANSPCIDCLKFYPPYVMHFDHRDPSTKLYNIADLTHGNISRDILLAEIAKCDVVCANCHAERTHQRGPVSRAVTVVVRLKWRNRPIADQHGRTFPSQRAAAIELGIRQVGISRVLGGKRKSYRGLVFSYV